MRVDDVTQWEVVSATAQISEAALKPVLEALLRQFPFRILVFHSDNGSEFINHIVAELLNKLLIEQTKSRPRHCNDNALVECKNGAVIRKHIGHGYIAAEHAAALALCDLPRTADGMRRIARATSARHGAQPPVGRP
jgi:transposase InsO family protein